MLRFTRILAVAAAALATAGGCNRADEEPEYRTVEGAVDSVDVGSGRVAMLWEHPKRHERVRISGTIDQNTVIDINGRVATLQDIRKNDRVKVTARIMRNGSVPPLVATRIEVVRDRIPASAPATQPATAAAGFE